MLQPRGTICAISTAPGVGGIAVIRVSGDESISTVDKIFRSSKPLSDRPANSVCYGKLVNGEEIVDEVVVTIFKGPHSFTGEDVVEIGCHGSIYIQKRVLELLLSSGATMAMAGEFTQRAYLNGKMDLSQAEAVADLIASGSAASHKMAINQMRGGFSKELAALRFELLNVVSLVELELDFGEEDVEFADRTQLTELSKRIYSKISSLAASFSLGNAIKNGVPVAIVGETNVGKSTLLNALLKDDKAIVSDIAGTTRDTIEDVVNIDGVQFRFIDTAGLRETIDEIESIGIERAKSKVEQAQIVLFLIDLASPLNETILKLNEIRELIDQQQLIIIGNKLDTVSTQFLDQVKGGLDVSEGEELLFISAKQQINIDKLSSLLTETVNINSRSESDIIVSNARHYEALIKAEEAISRVISGIEMEITNDFVAQDIRACIYHLGEITDTISTDEVLGNIFANFCIGK